MDEPQVTRCSISRTLTVIAVAMCWASAAALSAILLTAPVHAAEPASATERSPQTSTCQLDTGPSRAVTRVIDGESLALDDGSEVKLLGILAPRALDTADGATNWPPERDAIAALSALVLGRTIVLAFTKSRGSDRYGRLLAHVFVERDGHLTWVQSNLISGGHARAHTPPDHAQCLEELLKQEQPAREERRGLWSNAAYYERAAYRTRELMRFRNTFQIVSGRVRSVAERKGVVLLNFGRDWNDDFTVGIKTSKLPSATPSDIAALRALDGRRVRVRGWIERRNGPYIELAHMSDLEALDAPAEPVPSDQSPETLDQPVATGPLDAPSIGHRQAAERKRPEP